MDLHGDNAADAATAQLQEGESPMHQFALRSAIQLSASWELDFWLRYVDNLSSINISSYVTADVRLAWHPSKNLELAVVGQNLFEDQHAEFFQPSYGVPGQPSKVERGVYGKLTWRF